MSQPIERLLLPDVFFSSPATCCILVYIECDFELFELARVHCHTKLATKYEMLSANRDVDFIDPSIWIYFWSAFVLPSLSVLRALSFFTLHNIRCAIITFAVLF